MASYDLGTSTSVVYIDSLSVSPSAPVSDTTHAIASDGPLSVSITDSTPTTHENPDDHSSDDSNNCNDSWPDNNCFDCSSDYDSIGNRTHT